MPTYDYSCEHCGAMEIVHGIHEDNKTVCPECSLDGLVKLVSACGAIILAGRQMNQYNDVKYAKYWRDKNGVRHRVKSGDGYTGSATVNKQTATPEEKKTKRQDDFKDNHKKRLSLQKDRANTWNREHVK